MRRKLGYHSDTLIIYKLERTRVAVAWHVGQIGDEKMRRNGIVFSLGSVLALVLGGCGPQQASAPVVGAMPTPSVSVAEVIQQPIHDWHELTGRLEAPETVAVRPRVSGYIKQVLFTEGALVPKGGQLFLIDQRPFKAEVARLSADLKRAKASLKQAQQEDQRAKQLRSQRAISEEQADAREIRALEADANVASIQAALDLAQLQLDFTEVRASITGRVSRAQITKGNVVVAGETILTTQVATEQVYAYFDVDEQVYLRFRQLSRASNEPAQSIPVLMGLSHEQGYPHRGEINFVDNQVNPETGTIRARAVFDNGDSRFTPGLFARIKLVHPDAVERVLISDRAVATDLSNQYVLVLDDQQQAQYRRISLGARIEGLRIVTDGLQAHEVIVVNGLQHAMPGAKVAPEFVPMADPAVLNNIAYEQRQLSADEAVQHAADHEPMPVTFNQRLSTDYGG